MEPMQALYTERAFPVFQNRVYASREEAQSCPTGDIELIQDLTSGLVRNAAFRSSDVIYDTAYNNEQATSKRFQTHLDSVASIVEEQLGQRALIEVGCGKGYFLELLQGRGVEITGFDPTYEGTNAAIHRSYFIPDTGLSGSGLILRHVLEHVPDPVKFLEQLRDANGGKGLIYIEVPCLDWIMENKTWFDIFYEHVNYFRGVDFEKMFSGSPLITHSFNGQYLSVVADLAKLRRPTHDERHRVSFPTNFLDGTEKVGAVEGPLVVWGAASKGVIFSLIAERVGRPVDRIIDINPSKQGQHLPVTGLKVHPPQEGLAGLPDGTTLQVMNPNYLAEIRELVGPRFNCKGM